MKIIPIVASISAIYLGILLLDFIWLGIITKKFIISEFGSLISVVNGTIQIKITVGLLVWLIISIGCFFFAVLPGNSVLHSIGIGAALGFLMYAVYDLTNLAFITNYPLTFVFVDIAWGTFLCATISGIGKYIYELLV
jgi:uncharacterized membrane protein